MSNEIEESTYTDARWRHLANIRQGIITKLEKKIKNRDGEIRTLRIRLAEAEKNAA